MRKRKPPKRYLLPDPKFNDVLVTKFVNSLMYDGKKSTAYHIFYEAINIVQTKTSEMLGQLYIRHFGKRTVVGSTQKPEEAGLLATLFDPSHHQRTLLPSLDELTDEFGRIL